MFIFNRMDIVLFCFAGRRPYLNIQIQYILDVLEKNPKAQYHLWDFSRNEDDHAYLEQISGKHSRIILFNQFYQGKNNITACTKKIGTVCYCTKCRVGKWTEPYKYYASHESYANTVFIKIDDDVIYFPYKSLDQYLNQIRENPKYIVSANVVNNGVCACYNDLKPVCLRDESKTFSSVVDWFYLCTSKSFFHNCHKWFLESYKPDKNQYPWLTRVPMRSKFSINTIGFTYKIMTEISKKLQEAKDNSSDEETISYHFPFLIYNGFTTVHLHFSDQRSQISDSEEQIILEKYNNVAKTYRNTT